MKGTYILIGGIIHEGFDLDRLKQAICEVYVSANWGDTIISEEDLTSPEEIETMIDNDGFLFLCDDEDNGDINTLAKELEGLNIPHITHSMDGELSLFIPDVYGSEPIIVHADEERNVYVHSYMIKELIKKYENTKKMKGFIHELNDLIPTVNDLPRFEIVKLETGMEVNVIGGIDEDYSKDFSGRIESIDHVDNYATIIDQDDDAHDVDIGAIKQS